MYVHTYRADKHLKNLCASRKGVLECVCVHTYVHTCVRVHTCSSNIATAGTYHIWEVRLPRHGRASADLKVEVKARKWLTDVAIVCPTTKSVVARQYTHINPGVSAKAGEAVKRNKYKWAVQGFVQRLLRK